MSMATHWWSEPADYKHDDMVASTLYGMELVQSNAIPEGEIMFSGSRANGKSVFTERAMHEALAKLKRDNPENPRYAVINPQQYAMLKNLRWNEPEHLAFDNPALGKRMFYLIEQEEQKWQDLFAKQYI